MRLWVKKRKEILGQIWPTFSKLIQDTQFSKESEELISEKFVIAKPIQTKP